MFYYHLLFLYYLINNFQNVKCYVKCPYCDPNHMAYPNLEEAMRGYDVPMGNPNPGHGNTGKYHIICYTILGAELRVRNH